MKLCEKIGARLIHFSTTSVCGASVDNQPPVTSVLVINSGTAAYVRTDGMKKLAIALPISSNVINLILDYVFMKIFGWGVAGAGWATVAGYAVGSLLLIFYFTAKQRTVHFTKVSHKDIKILLSVLQTGLPTALIHVCNAVRTYAVNGIILAAAGTIGMKVVTICMSAFNLALIFINGSATTLMPICGALYGERDHHGVRYVLRFSLIITEIMCFVVLGVFEIFPLQVGGLFGKLSPEAAAQLETALRIFSLCIPFYGISYILRAFYQSTKQRGAASLFTILEGVVFIIPLIYLFAATNQQLMWLSFALAEAASILLTVITMQIMAKRKNRKNFLMLDNAAERNVLDMTISNRIENITDFRPGRDLPVHHGIEHLGHDHKVSAGFAAGRGDALLDCRQFPQIHGIPQIASGYYYLIAIRYKLPKPVYSIPVFYLCQQTYIPASRTIERTAYFYQILPAADKRLHDSSYAVFFCPFQLIPVVFCHGRSLKSMPWKSHTFSAFKKTSPDDVQHNPPLM